MTHEFGHVVGLLHPTASDVGPCCLAEDAVPTMVSPGLTPEGNDCFRWGIFEPYAELTTLSESDKNVIWELYNGLHEWPWQDYSGGSFLLGENCVSTPVLLELLSARYDHGELRLALNCPSRAEAYSVESARSEWGPWSRIGIAQVAQRGSDCEIVSMYDMPVEHGWVRVVGMTSGEVSIATEVSMIHPPKVIASNPTASDVSGSIRFSGLSPDNEYVASLFSISGKLLGRIRIAGLTAKRLRVSDFTSANVHDGVYIVDLKHKGDSIGQSKLTVLN